MSDATRLHHQNATSGKPEGYSGSESTEKGGSAHGFSHGGSAHIHDHTKANVSRSHGGHVHHTRHGKR